MKLKILTFIAAALLAMSGSVQSAPFHNGIMLKVNCQSEWENKWGRGLCEGYLVAIADAFNGSEFCLPDRINRGDLAPIFIGYAAAATLRELDALAPAVVVSAFRQAFPCE